MTVQFSTSFFVQLSCFKSFHPLPILQRNIPLSPCTNYPRRNGNQLGPFCDRTSFSKAYNNYKYVLNHCTLVFQSLVVPYQQQFINENTSMGCHANKDYQLIFLLANLKIPILCLFPNTDGDQECYKSKTVVI